jgi:hypothetical protein
MRFRAAIALALVLAACGSGSNDGEEGVASLEEPTVTATTTAEPVDAETAAIAFTECMRENGIDMEDPTVDSDGNVIPGRPTDLPEPEDGEQVQVGPGELGEDLRAAFEECGELLEGTAFGFTAGDQSELEDQLVELAACLRAQGIDVADPDLSNPPSGEPGEGGPFGIDFEDPDVQAALEACQEFVPNFAGGPGDGGPRLGVAPGPEDQ